MDETPTADRDHISRWIQDGQQILGLLPGLLEQQERSRARAADVEQEIDKLRHDVAELRLENQQLRTERDEMADAFNKLMSDVVTPMNEIATRIKVTPRRSPFERDPRATGPSSAPSQAPTPSS
jgi:chromosome segregation ATPase